MNTRRVAIVDYGLGNLFSVRQACVHVGLDAMVTSDKAEVLGADAVILPGVGAFGDAMGALRSLDLDVVLRDIAASETPLLGICLGMQLLMTESYEFGVHQGLGCIEGVVDKLAAPDGARQIKVPHVGWESIHPAGGAPERWRSTLLEGIAPGEFMYFVHSFIARPLDPSVELSVSAYGGMTFCSSLGRRNIFACQFHPERSGEAGLRMYRTWAAMLGSIAGRPATASR